MNIKSFCWFGLWFLWIVSWAFLCMSMAMWLLCAYCFLCGFSLLEGSIRSLFIPSFGTWVSWPLGPRGWAGSMNRGRSMVWWGGGAWKQCVPSSISLLSLHKVTSLGWSQPSPSQWQPAAKSLQGQRGSLGGSMHSPSAPVLVGSGTTRVLAYMRVYIPSRQLTLF